MTDVVTSPVRSSPIRTGTITGGGEPTAGAGIAADVHVAFIVEPTSLAIAVADGLARTS